MDYKDYYKVMGLSQDATPKDIKTAYRKLARQYHPDLNKEADAEANFKALGEAYEVLKDPEKRKIYDQYNRDMAFNKQSQRGAHSNAWDGFDGAQYQNTADFFESLFGARATHQTPSKGADLTAQIRITLEEAYQGVVKEITLPKVCQSVSQPLRVKIPAGSRTGQQLRLAGMGQKGRGDAGDLYLTINIDKHPFFDVMGQDIYVTLPVAPWEVALGSTVVVPTLGGKVDLKIPPGTQGGQTLRLKKRGLAGGDQLVMLKIVIPQPVTEKARVLYQTMAQDMPFNPRDKMGV